MCRRVRELHFVDIVDVEQLLEAMAQDVPQVAQRVQKLLLPSYFPGLHQCFHAMLPLHWTVFKSPLIPPSHTHSHSHPCSP